MMKKYLLILLLPIWNSIIAQNDDKLKFLPQSPEVQSLQKFIDQPVSLHNGTVDISIPIYTLKINNQLALPLSASYNTSGIKVSERAGSIGLGWNITNPGVAIRRVRGGPDNIVSLKSAQYDLKNRVYNFDLYKDLYAGNLLATIDENDYEPDEYIINFLGNSLKVVFDDSIPGNDLGEKFVQIPLSDNKVVAILNNGIIVGWEVIDPKGNIFYFGSEAGNQNSAVENENSPNILTYGGYQASGGNSTPSYSKAWYLIKIKTTDNKVVQFYYQYKGNSTVANILGETSYKCGAMNYPYLTNQYLDQLCNQESLPTTQISYSIQTNDDLYIDRIESETTKIKFNHLIVRADIDNAKRLDNINILDSNNKAIKKINFVFSYFQPTIGNNCFIEKLKQNSIFSNHITTQSKRLKLDKILENDQQNTKVSEYKFEYFSDQMPNIMSSAQDHWGYYNGQNDNCGFLPTLQFRVFEDSYLGIYLMGKNDRSESESNLQYGSLKKITYPTGGSINLEYEKNTVSAYMNESISSYTEINPTSEIILTAEQHVDPNTNAPYYSDIEYTLEFDYDTNMTFGSSDYEFNPEGVAFYRNFMIESTDPAFQTRLVPYNESIPIKKFETYKIKAQLDPHSLENSWSDEGYMPSYGVLLNVRYTIQPKNLFYAGGLRIKRIIHRDTNDTPQIIKEFDYGDSGIGLNYPFYVEQEYIQHLPIVKLYGLASFPLNSIFANNISYENVTTYQTNINTGEKIKSEFNFHPITIDQLMEVGDYNITNHLYPRNLFTLPMRMQYSNWRLGNLIKQTDYVFANGNYRIQKEIINNYGRQKDYYYNNPIFGFRLERRGHWLSGPSFEYYYTYKWEFYSIYTEKYDLINSKTTNYFNNISNQTVNDYMYTNPSNFQLSSQKTIDSDSSITVSSYSYAHEKSNQYLIGKNMIGIPLETTVSKTKDGITKRLSKSEIVYPVSQTEADTKTSGLALPYQVKSTDHLGINSTEVTYDKYDLKGNLQQYTTKDGVPTTIIWGYNSTQPIAKVTGISYSVASALASEIITASDADINAGTEQTLIDKLDAFRKNTALQNAQIITYTYDPLIGVTSITPPSGIREIYKYDSANRLESIKDVNGKIIKEFQYNYKH